MPTGLTSKIYEGEDTSLRGFALTCVRQLGFGYYASNYGEMALPLDKAPDIKPSSHCHFVFCKDVVPITYGGVVF